MSLSRALVIIVAIAMAVAAAYALSRAMDERSAPPIVITDADALLPVTVDVRGAVSDPGVYKLAPGARAQDAIESAGGLTANADLSTINLARRLRDGEVIVVAELPGGPGTPTPSFAGEAGAAQSETPRININTASAKELDALPGIGEVMAGRIVTFRESNGPYRSIDDLVHVQGISTRTIEGFRDLVTTGP